MDERRYADQEMRYSKVQTVCMKYVAHIWRRVVENEQADRDPEQIPPGRKVYLFTTELLRKLRI